MNVENADNVLQDVNKYGDFDSEIRLAWNLQNSNCLQSFTTVTLIYSGTIRGPGKLRLHLATSLAIDGGDA